jgi:uncharacterized protein YndB with AHSA1/START domain
MTDPTHEEALAPEQPGTFLSIEREFAFPRERVWMAWTDPDQVRLWWGPTGFSTPVCRLSLRVGGEFFVCMRSPEGKDHCSIGFYREIKAPERLVASLSFADLKGNVVPATAYGMNPSFPREMLLSVTFMESGGKTRLRLKQDGIPPGKDVDDARKGWNQSFDKLAVVLAAAEEKPFDK